MKILIEDGHFTQSGLCLIEAFDNFIGIGGIPMSMESTTKVLNLYAGIGGNRKLWSDVDVTAVEWDEDKAEVYRDHFPDDRVVVTDAHEYLLEHFNEYDFIWASPPCPTHSQMRKSVHQGKRPVYPDMSLYQEILLLQHSYDGDYAIENVEPYYEPLIDGVMRGRHMFWASYTIPSVDIETEHISNSGAPKDKVKRLENMYEFDTSGYGLSLQKRRKMLNNVVHPELGKHVLESRGKQTTLV